LDNVEVTPEEVTEALNGPSSNSSAPQNHPKEEVYEDDYETAYRQQAATSNFRGHSPVREVKAQTCCYQLSFSSGIVLFKFPFKNFNIFQSFLQITS
jgi:hypothetical protein